VTSLSVSTPDGSALAVQTSGPDDAPALLLLQGQANSHVWWDRLRQGFEDAYRTITFDYRGTGSTESAFGPWSTSSFAQDAAHVLDALEVRRAYVYGTSMGGRVAQMLAIEHPHLVERLVLACTSPGGTLASERSNDVRRRLADPDPEARHRALVELFYTPDWAATHSRSDLFGDPSMTSRAQQLHLRVSSQHDASRRLHEIVAPTLVLHGSDDLMSPASNAIAITDRVPDSSLEITAGGRHGFFDEFSATVTPRVAQFLS
jgi:pimeloyl-ACP methyl ester carboxylesterase